MDRHPVSILFHTPWSIFRREGPLVDRLFDLLVGLFICAMTFSRYCHVALQVGTRVVDAHGGGFGECRTMTYFRYVQPAAQIHTMAGHPEWITRNRLSLFEDLEPRVRFWQNLGHHLASVLGVAHPAPPFNCVSFISFVIGRPDLASFSPKALMRLLRLEADTRILYAQQICRDLDALVDALDAESAGPVIVNSGPPDCRDRTERYNQCVTLAPGTGGVSTHRPRSDRVAQVEADRASVEA